jgi:ribose-phosphate pyrophosphokinase
MIIVGGSASQNLSKELARELGCQNAEVTYKRFPDDEAYVRVLDDLENEEVILVQTSYPDDNIIELFILQDAIKDFNIKKLITVVPYFGYARQDKKFNTGEPISARNLARHIGLFSDEVLTVDIHEESILGWFNTPAKNASAMPQIGLCLKDIGVDMVVSPDKGAVDLVKKVGEVMDCPWDYLEKTRLDGENVEIKPKSLAVAGKRVAIVDDIISTGGTILTANRQLKGQGAETVIAACTHGLFAKNALDRLTPDLDRIISTDTIENETTSVSVAPEIAKVLGN